MVYMPGHVSDEHESWYINMGTRDKVFLDPHRMERLGH